MKIDGIHIYDREKIKTSLVAESIYRTRAEFAVGKFA